MPLSDPVEYYQARVEAESVVATELKKRAEVASLSRKLTFGMWVVLFLLGTLGYLSVPVAWGVASVSFVAFIGLLAWHERLQERLSVTETRVTIARTQQARIARRWQDVPECPSNVPASGTTLSDDLDLFGHASVFQLLCRCHTPAGRNRLRDWLLDGAAPEAISPRQAAARALAPERDFREELDLRGRVLAASQAGPSHFVAWAEGPLWIANRSWLILTARALVMGFFVAMLLGILGVIAEPWALGICLAILAANLLISVLLVGSVHDIFDRVDSRHRDIAHYEALFAMFAELPADSPLLQSLKERMSADHLSAEQTLAKLARIMKIAQMRHSATLGIVHLGLQLLFLIDFHVLVVLERWQVKYGQYVRGWFDALAELEALASLASLHHDQPQWSFPQVDRQSARYSSSQLGHPLLAKPTLNDVSVGPAGRFLLVSGSNMSGKSTLLRALGINAILAQAGAPVCATALTLPPVELATSMRIQDSLEDGISFFMAELNRLKAVVDHAARLRATSDRTLLFLLDEILQGTNSAERHIAVERVVQRLTECAAMGAISTHDLELARSAELAKVCDPIHFRESFSPSGEMTFDYEMRSGVATTTNALKLLELVGID